MQLKILNIFDSGRWKGTPYPKKFWGKVLIYIAYLEEVTEFPEQKRKFQTLARKWKKIR